MEESEYDVTVEEGSLRVTDVAPADDGRYWMTVEGRVLVRPEMALQLLLSHGRARVTSVRERFLTVRVETDIPTKNVNFIRHALDNPEWLALGESDFQLAKGDIQLARKIHGHPVIMLEGDWWCELHSASREYVKGDTYYVFLGDVLPGKRYQVDEKTVLIVPTTTIGEVIVEYLSRHEIRWNTAKMLSRKTPEEIAAILLSRSILEAR